MAMRPASEAKLHSGGPEGTHDTSVMMNPPVPQHDIMAIILPYYNMTLKQYPVRT